MGAKACLYTRGSCNRMKAASLRARRAPTNSPALRYGIRALPGDPASPPRRKPTPAFPAEPRSPGGVLPNAHLRRLFPGAVPSARPGGAGQRPEPLGRRGEEAALRFQSGRGPAPEGTPGSPDTCRPPPPHHHPLSGPGLPSPVLTPAIPPRGAARRAERRGWLTARRAPAAPPPAGGARERAGAPPAAAPPLASRIRRPPIGGRAGRAPPSGEWRSPAGERRPAVRGGRPAGSAPRLPSPQRKARARPAKGTAGFSQRPETGARC